MGKTFKKGIHVYQKWNGLNTDQSIAIKDAAEFYGRKLMSARLFNRLAIRIELRKTKLDKIIRGQVTSTSNGSKSSKNFNIIIDNKMSLNQMLSTLAHEMIHVKQIATNQFQKRFWSTDHLLHARWEGKELGSLYSIPYAERPWEKEAFGGQKTLSTEYMTQSKILNLDKEAVAYLYGRAA